MNVIVTGRVVLDLSDWHPNHGLSDLRDRLAVLASCPRNCEVVILVGRVVPPLEVPIAWPLPMTPPAGLRLTVEGESPTVVAAVVNRLRYALGSLDHRGVAA